MSPADRERARSFLLAFAALLVAATCSRTGRLEPRAPNAKVAASGREAAPAPAPSGASGAATATPVAAAAAPVGLLLPHFDRALEELEHKTRKEPVRIVWLGDSHTAADFMTGALRRKLFARFGAGGPGFVRLGASAYRHDGVRLTHEGRFRIEPAPPSRRTPEGDAALGYYGLRTIPRDGRAHVALRLADGTQGSVRYELLFDLPRGARFELSLGHATRSIDARTKVERVPGSPILHYHFEGDASDELELGGFENGPRFYGVIVESRAPGVVLDTSGIDGARVGTALAWDPDVLAAELGARRPELLAIAYGTNEAFDHSRAELIGTELTTLVERLRRGAPDADCLVVGPPDAAAPDLLSLPHVIEIEEVLRGAASRLGCAFFSLRDVMGGDGGFARWMHESPSLARSDRIHFTVGGYDRLGDALGDALITTYELTRPAP